MNGNKWTGFLSNTTILVISIAVIGALLYAAFLYKNGLFQDIQMGEKASSAKSTLDGLRSSFVSLKEQGLIIAQSSDSEKAASAIESSINADRQKLSKYIKQSEYSGELSAMAPKLMVSFEAWSSLESEMARKGGAQSDLSNRSLSAFINLMGVIGDSEEVRQGDVSKGAQASRTLLTATLALIALIFILSLWWLWYYSTTERRHYKNVRELRQMSNTDTLTGLTNRVVLEDRCSIAIAGARRFGSSVGILYIDIDGLNQLNVEKGYQSGDLVLKEAALRLQKHTREMDTVARMGEDEFSVLASNLKSKDDITVVAKKLKDVLTKPIELGKEKYTLRASIGAAVFPDDGETAEQLVNSANSAMYKAKGTGNQSQASIQH